MPLFNERVTEGSGAVRIGQQSEYQRWLRECWSEELQRELTPAEIEARKRGQSLPPANGYSPDCSDYAAMCERDRQRARLERERREAAQKAAVDFVRRKEVEAHQQAFLLEDELDRDMKERLGL